MNTTQFLTRYLSRKFLLALAGPIVALIVAFRPDLTDQANAVAQSVVDVLVALAAIATPVAFIMGESRIDAARVEADATKTVAAVENAPPAVAKAVANEVMDNPK